jgi:hypothetical protein
MFILLLSKYMKMSDCWNFISTKVPFQLATEQLI